MSDAKSHYWANAAPLKFGIGWSDLDDAMFGSHRATITVYDEGAGRYLGVEFFNSEPGTGETESQGFFCTHADIDAFASHLHDMLEMAKNDPAR